MLNVPVSCAAAESFRRNHSVSTLRRRVSRAPIVELKSAESNAARRWTPANRVVGLHGHRPIRYIIDGEASGQCVSGNCLRERAATVAAYNRDSILIDRTVARIGRLPRGNE